MPIRPENKHLYPGGSPTSKEWKSLRQRILEREDHCCKACRVPNHQTIYRKPDGGWEEGPQWHPPANSKTVRIILTIAHLDHDPTNNTDDNLAALCQRCHNQHDAPHRAANAAKTRKAKGIEHA